MGYPLGSMRSAAQMISYSVNLSLIILAVLFVHGSINLLDIIYAQIPIASFYSLLPLAFLFIISAVAETNRAPFDIPKAYPIGFPKSWFIFISDLFGSPAPEAGATILAWIPGAAFALPSETITII